MALNREWHAAHRPGRNASPEERRHWHLGHALHCRCRDMPEGIRREFARRGLLPDPRQPTPAVGGATHGADTGMGG